MGVQIALQLNGLLLLSLALGNLQLADMLLSYDSFLFELNFPQVPLHLLLALQLLVVLLLVVEFPALLLLLLLRFDPLDRLVLLHLDLPEQLVPVKLLQFRADVHVVLAALLVLLLGFVLLPVEVLLPQNQLLMELFHLLVELVIFLFQRLFFVLLGALRYGLHLAVRVFGHFHFLAEVLLVGLLRVLLLGFNPLDHTLHLIFMLLLTVDLVRKNQLSLRPFHLILLFHEVDSFSIN